MNKPKMLLFDFGDTICVSKTEPNFLRGTRKILELADNTNGAVAEEVQDFAENVLYELYKSEGDVEIVEQSFHRFLYTYFGVTFSKTPLDLEKVFWKEAFDFKPADGIYELFDELDKMGIRKAVLSNNAFAEETLREELDKYFKKDEFDFVISTADYCIRKPSHLIFKLALKMAGLGSDEVWYAGNSFYHDIYGASTAGLYPVWYNLVGAACADKYNEIERLEISSWSMLTKLLKEL